MMSTKQVNRPAHCALVGEPHTLSPTSIYCWKCHCVVPMEILGLGLSWTGTSSLRQVLIDLGYDDCYHFATPLNENPPDCALWSAAMDAKFLWKGKEFSQEEWDQLLGHCCAITDTPCVKYSMRNLWLCTQMRKWSWLFVTWLSSGIILHAGW